MSAIRKLEQLLSRVQSRRAEPRVRSAVEPMRHPVHAEPQHGEPIALKPEMMRVPPPAPVPVAASEPPREVSLERPSRPASTPLEDAMGQLGKPAPFQLTPTPVAVMPQAASATPHAEDDLVLDDFDDGPPTIRPPETFDAPVRTIAKLEPAKPEPAKLEPTKSDLGKLEEDKPTRVAPALPDQPVARAEPVKPLRVATAEPVAASPVVTVSQARAFVPKTFAQLVERSLALRPRR